MAGTEKVSKITEATEKLLEMWASDKMPEALAAIAIRKQSGDFIPSDKWSFANHVLMMLAGTDDARGFRQWEEVDRMVNKGSKAFYILGPMVKTRMKKNETTGVEEKVTWIAGFRGIPVFRCEDTDGAELIRPDYAPPVLPPLMNVAETWGVKVSYGETITAGAWGRFNSGSQEIRLGTHAEKTFFHELAHAAHQRVNGGQLKGGQDPHQEIVAETAAAVLSVMYGVQADIKRAREYVASYAKVTPENATKALTKHLSVVEKVLNLILTTAHEAGVSEVAA